MKFLNVIAIKTSIQVYSILNVCTGISAPNSSSNPGGHQMGLCGNEVSWTGTQDKLDELTSISVKFHVTKHEWVQTTRKIGSITAFKCNLLRFAFWSRAETQGLRLRANNHIKVSRHFSDWDELQAHFIKHSHWPHYSHSPFQEMLWWLVNTVKFNKTIVCTT